MNPDVIGWGAEPRFTAFGIAAAMLLLAFLAWLAIKGSRQTVQQPAVPEAPLP